MENTNYEVSGIICFGIMLIRNTHTDKPFKFNSRILGTSKRVNASESLFRKFDLRKILSISYMGKRK